MPEYLHRTNTLKSWAEDDRPREKMMLKGKAALSDAELLAIIMGSGNREETAVDLAKRILADVDNNWHELSRLNIKDLCEYKGIGEAKAISIITALEIGARKAHQLALEKPIINSSKSAFKVLQPMMADLVTEEFWCVFLNQSSRVISIDKLSSGGISQTIVDKRIIFKMALDKLASAIILAHNHPSGSLKPSPQDIKLTKSIKKAGELLDIALFDHIILTQTAYYSFADKENL